VSKGEEKSSYRELASDLDCQKPTSFTAPILFRFNWSRRERKESSSSSSFPLKYEREERATSGREKAWDLLIEMREGLRAKTR